MRPYNGPPKLKQLAHLRKNYKGKNMNGGRKCLFTQSRQYKLKSWRPCAIQWCNRSSLLYFVPPANLGVKLGI